MLTRWNAAPVEDIRDKLQTEHPEAIKDAYKDGQNLYYVSLNEGYEMHTRWGWATSFRNIDFRYIAEIVRSIRKERKEKRGEDNII